MLNLFLRPILYILFVGFNAVVLAKELSITKDQFVVVLDAGHGGHDSGNRGSGYYEKNIALEIVLQTGKILEKNPNIKVIYTRKTDVFIPLNKRADIANNAKADLFVSVHCNAHNSSAYGTETFVLGLHANERNFDIAKKENSVILLEDNYKINYDGFDPNSPESIIGLTLMQEEYLEQSLDLASKIQSNFTSQLKRYNRGVKQAGFLVLHRTFMPSVLIETGFLTNKNEGKFLNSSKGKQSIASAIAKAILKYKGDIATMYTPDFPVVDEKETTLAEDGSIAEGINTIKDEVVFKVQILAGSTKMETTPLNFNGLDGISFIEQDTVFKYFYGSEKNYEKAKHKKDIAINKGYKSCFIVAFKNGQQIPLSKVVN